ncbi:MAG: hypothetical protein HUU06_00275 [Planctomycetaceae bacterium]|nr:hypothetical protein [Planctomycetota bacterium]NUN51211.1 hypothetical protein [Planctomycetaceae bacterium]
MPSDTAQFVDVVLSWSREVPGKTAVLRKEDGGNWDELARVEETEYTVRGLHPDRSHTFAAAPVLEDGGLAPEADWETVQVSPLADAGTPALPGTPTGFAAAQDGANLNFRWDAASDGVTESFEVRVGDSWEDGVLVADGIEGPPYSWPWSASGARAFHLKATDKLGRYSTEGASIALTIASLDDHNDAGAEDQGGAGWPGASTNLEPDGAGGLQLASLQGGWQDPPWDGPWSDAKFPALARNYPEGTYETPAIDLGAVESHRIEVDLRAAQSMPEVPWSEWDWPALGPVRDEDGALLPLGTRGHTSKDTWSGDPIDSVGGAVEVDTSPTPAGPWDGWRLFVPGTYSFQRVRLRVTLRGDGIRLARLPRLVLRRRKFNRKQEGDVVVGPDADVVIPFPVPFQNAPRVTAHLIGYPGSVEIVSITPTQVTLRPGAAVFVESTATFAPTIHWQAMGT